MSLLLSFYADDFTGATDSLEVMARKGFKTMLFLEPPTPEFLSERYPYLDCFGVAGVSRAMTPPEMEQELKPILEQIKEHQAPIMHYKICSTCDSSPKLGSVGKVIDMAKDMYPNQVIPLLAAAPFLKRYTVFGNHFAHVAGQTYRLDRHPVMSKHPVTPIKEADLLKHFAEQTSASFELINCNDLDFHTQDGLSRLFHEKGSKAEVVIFDAIHDQHMQQIGELFSTLSDGESRFIIGSSGVQHALASYWQRLKNQDRQLGNRLSVEKKDNIIVLSGSCSPVTSAQIKLALDSGFYGIHLPVSKLLHPDESNSAVDLVLKEACEAVEQGKCVILYTALEPNDVITDKDKVQLNKLGLNSGKIGQLLGEQIGRIAKRLILQTNIRRFVFAGGDTSGFAASELGIYGLEMICSTALGAPLCKCYSEDKVINGLELALKGGQLGQADYFLRVLSGETH